MTENAFTARHSALFTPILVAAALAAVPLHAAQPTPGTVQDTIEQEPPQVPLPMDVAPDFERDVDPKMQQPVGPQVTVERFEVVGNQAIDDATLLAALEGFIGKAVSLNEIYSAADALTALYRDRGYGLANVIVPAQRITDGVIRLEVIEGRIGSVSVTGNELYSFDFLNDRLAGLEPGTIYRSDEMERGVLLLNDLPGLAARAVIKPGEEYGSSDLLFKVSEDAAEFSASIDNYGREGLGEIRATATAAFNSLTGHGDRLTITGLVSEGAALKYGNLSYGIPVSTDGDRLRFTYNMADYEVEGGEFALLGITGDNTTYRVDWSSPLVRSRNFNVVFTTAMLRQETDSFILGAALPDNSTELNLLELALFMSGVQESGHSWSFSSILSGNGKSNDSTVADPVTDAQQAKLRVDGSYSIPFARRWLFQARGTAVYSDDPLVDSQKFSLGGPYSVRGYFPAEQRGDHGGFLALELRRYFLVSKYPIAASLFVDGGYAKNELLPGEADYPARSGELGSAGMGLLFAPDGSRFSGSIMYAEPIDNHTSLAGDDDGHLWASFQVTF